MRTTLFLLGTALFLGASSFGADDTQVLPPPEAKAPAIKKTVTKDSIAQPGDAAVAAKQAADEIAIRQSDAAFVTAYQQGDAKAVAALFTPDAEYVDEQGTLFQGRDAIEESLTGFFTEHADCKLQLTVETIRFLSPEVAIEDGRTLAIHTEFSTPIESRYTSIHVKTNGKWMVASVRDHAPKGRREHSAQLQQLNWLTGAWVDEGDDLIVNFSCQPSDNGNFLLRTFSIQVAGQETMTGTQRIGWNPLTSKLQAWIFDSEGGHAEGSWYRAGESWVLKCTGVTADGESASCSSIYTPVNEHTMTWQSVDHEVGGVQQPDSRVITIVRHAPSPAPVVASDRN
jgi:uncharacterized protein (TIGR02246 family)